MSYNSELQSNNTDLQSILETINNLPSAGGSGGGAVETCTVIINDNDSGAIATAYATVYRNGVCDCYYINNIMEYGSVTIEDVVCGSAVYANIYTHVPDEFISLNNMTLIERHGNESFLKAPTTGGSTGRVSIG